MIFNRLDDNNAPVLNVPEPAEPRPGFFGRLWRRIKGNVGTIVSLIIPGPLGAIAGAWLQNWIDGGGEVGGLRVGTLPTTTTTSTSPTDYLPTLNNDAAYPLTIKEENRIDAFVETQLKPTLLGLINKMSSGNSITTINEVLQAISTIKTHANTLLQYGERTTILGLSSYSTNYVKQKTDIITLYAEGIEKIAIDYVENKPEFNYQLVLEPFQNSSVTTIETMSLDWQSKNVTANIKRYIDAAQPTTQNQIAVVVTNTDPDSTAPVLDDASTVIDNQTDITPSSNTILKISGAIGLIAILYSLTKKKNKN